jgi:outer membrane protein W
VKTILFLILAVTFSFPSFAATKDFKGLFGSYRREKFTENEAHDSDWGVDLSLSTLLPVTSVVNSTATGGAGNPMRYSNFFNVEGSLLFSLAYHWQIYASVGHFSYDTRKENTNTNATNALFHQFEFEAIPVLLGTRYRFSVDDIVPYIGAGIGISSVRRKGSYDSGSLSNEEKNSVLTGQVQAGLEFYFSPRAGLRMEIAGYYFNCPAYTFAQGSDKSINPDMIYQSNIFSVRYASGLFFLF